MFGFGFTLFISLSKVFMIVNPYRRILAINEKLKRQDIIVLNVLISLKFLKTTEFTSVLKAKYPKTPKRQPKTNEKAMKL